jgi:hypothetical protein
MPAEGMVDALVRAGRLLTPNGRVIDIHPTPEPARVEVGARESGGHSIGELDAPDAVERHRAADAAVANAVAQGLFIVEATREFSFHSYADSVRELADYVAQKFRTTRIGPETGRRAEVALRAQPTATVWVHERVRVSKLRRQ